jgi:hypothetical protein
MVRDMPGERVLTHTADVARREDCDALVAATSSASAGWTRWLTPPA